MIIVTKKFVVKLTNSYSYVAIAVTLIQRLHVMAWHIHTSHLVAVATMYITTIHVYNKLVARYDVIYLVSTTIM